MPERIPIPEAAPVTPPSERLPSPESFPAVPKEQGQPHPPEQQQEPALLATPQGQAEPTIAPEILQREVESILSEGLNDAYAAMDPLTQKEFKEEGEQTAREIRSLLADARLKINKLIKILTQWLQMIPGVSRLFVEQEAKIKTDKLLTLRRRERNETE